MRLRREITGLLIILLLAIILRVWGIDFGLPFEYHVDEVQYVRQAAAMGREGLEPAWWNNPPFYKYLFLVEYGILFLFGKFAGWYASPADFGGQCTFDPSLLYLLARGTSAILGALTVLVVYLIGKTVYNRRTGVIAAWFLAVCFLHVRASHFAVNDVAATFFMMIALWGSLLLMEQATKWRYLWVGAMIGLAFATKYTGIMAVIPFVLAAFLTPKERRMKEFNRPRLTGILIASASAVATAILASPYFVLTPGKVIQQVYEALYLAGKYGFEGWQIHPEDGYIFYAGALSWGMTLPLLVLVAAGLGFGIFTHRRQEMVLLSLPVVLYICMGRQEMCFARFILPVIPVLVVLAAAGLARLVTGFVKGRHAARLLLAGGALLLAIPSLSASLRFDYLLKQTDTRTLAKEWIETNIPAGSKIAVDWEVYAPPLASEQASVPNSSRQYQVAVVGGKGFSEHPIDWYDEQGFDYLISSSFIYNIPLSDQQENIERERLYAELGQEFELIQVFWPTAYFTEPPFAFDEIYGPAISLWDRNRPGPVIRLYRLP